VPGREQSLEGHGSHPPSDLRSIASCCSVLPHPADAGGCCTEHGSGGDAAALIPALARTPLPLAHAPRTAPRRNCPVQNPARNSPGSRDPIRSESWFAVPLDGGASVVRVGPCSRAHTGTSHCERLVVEGLANLPSSRMAADSSDRGCYCRRRPSDVDAHPGPAPCRCHELQQRTGDTSEWEDSPNIDDRLSPTIAVTARLASDWDRQTECRQREQVPTQTIAGALGCLAQYLRRCARGRAIARQPGRIEPSTTSTYFPKLSCIALSRADSAASPAAAIRCRHSPARRR